MGTTPIGVDFFARTSRRATYHYIEKEKKWNTPEKALQIYHNTTLTQIKHLEEGETLRSSQTPSPNLLPSSEKSLNETREGTLEHTVIHMLPKNPSTKNHQVPRITKRQQG
jgi:hypothetical protein